VHTAYQSYRCSHRGAHLSIPLSEPMQLVAVS